MKPLETKKRLQLNIGKALRITHPARVAVLPMRNHRHPVQTYLRSSAAVIVAPSSRAAKSTAKGEENGRWNSDLLGHTSNTRQLVA